jgi:hypothetical protein
MDARFRPGAIPAPPFFPASARRRAAKARRPGAAAAIALNYEAEHQCQEIRIRAERECGKRLRELPKATGGEYGGRAKIDGHRAGPSNPKPTLNDLGTPLATPKPG